MSYPGYMLAVLVTIPFTVIQKFCEEDLPEIIGLMEYKSYRSEKEYLNR